ncbi:hypothetical protein [Fibrobacter sp.]|uniref:hypothetical protein n=1 Tax=Fibrobacter sp. TaxID=35828 RepID=UPI0025C49787|nr:hypothetical protein [Fibrobacter sp.]MBR3070770.1 hypothetical protein [Fibrobacter sp.]
MYKDERISSSSNEVRGSSEVSYRILVIPDLFRDQLTHSVILEAVILEPVILEAKRRGTIISWFAFGDRTHYCLESHLSKD